MHRALYSVLFFALYCTLLFSPSFAQKLCTVRLSTCDPNTPDSCCAPEAQNTCNTFSPGQCTTFTSSVNGNRIVFYIRASCPADLQFYNNAQCLGTPDPDGRTGDSPLCVPTSKDGTNFAFLVVCPNVVVPTNTPTATPTSNVSATPTPSSNGVCFSATATVEMPDGSHRRMDELQIGDRVRVSATYKQFSEVYMFGHKDSNTFDSSFVLIDLDSGNTLELTANHLVYANNRLVRADKVLPGDTMETTDLGVTRVSATRHGLIRKGLFNPHTLHGDIIVNGVRVSTFTHATRRAPLAQCLLTVERLAYRMGVSIFGSMLHVSRPKLFDAVLRVLPASH